MKKAQTATIDLLLAVGIVVVVSVVAATLFTGVQQPARLAPDAQALAGALFNPYPHNWSNQTVISPGFVTDHRLNDTLFAQFQNLPDVQRLAGINSFYYVNTTLGDAGTPPTQASDVYAVTRYAAHQGNITPIEVIVWLD